MATIKTRKARIVKTEDVQEDTTHLPYDRCDTCGCKILKGGTTCVSCYAELLYGSWDGIVTPAPAIRNTTCRK